MRVIFFFFNDTATTEIYTLSLHDALPISAAAPPASPRRSATARRAPWRARARGRGRAAWGCRSEEHTSELQSRSDLVCRLLLEKKKKQANQQSQILQNKPPSEPRCRRGIG